MTQDTKDRIIAIIAEQALLDVTDILPDARLADLGIDSLGMVEAIFAMEEAFDITIPFNANAPDQADFDMSTITSIFDAVEALIAKRAA